MKHEIKILKSSILVDFTDALNFMQLKIKEILERNEIGYLWFLEHPSIYTGGLNANENDLLNRDSLPVYNTDRGGLYTYHGPGQRIIYTILNLKILQKGEPDIKKFIYNLEEVIICTLKNLGITSYRIEGKIGVWTNYEGEPHKIASLGLRVKNWVTYHGLAININPDLEHFSGIVPCGIKDCKVISSEKIIASATIDQLDDNFLKYFSSIFQVKLKED